MSVDSDLPRRHGAGIAADSKQHKRLVFDGRYGHEGVGGGISRYSLGLGNALSRITPLTILVSDDAQARLYPAATDFILGPHPESAREILTGILLNRAGADLVYSPMQTVGGFSRNFKLILTLHDLTYYTWRRPPESLRLTTRAIWRLFHSSFALQRLVLNRADHIVTISKSTASLMAERGISTQDITVVYPAVDKFRSALRATGGAAPANLVYVGSLARHKGVETLIRGMQYLPDRTLHVVTSASERSIRRVHRLIPDGAQVLFHRQMSDERYADLLADDAVAVSGTLSEGFCLPPVEAAAMGVPSVITDLPVLREAVGPGAIYFEPRSPESFAGAVKQLDDPSIRNRLATAGQAYSRRYSWRDSAHDLLAVAQRLLREG